ncbi:MAG: hypothetical protein V1934_05180 [Methanobacteriota archaeon]
MTIETIKKTDAGRELKIVDVSGANRRKQAVKSAAVMLVAALVFGLAFAAVAEGAHISHGYDGEPRAAEDDGGARPWVKLPIPDSDSVPGGVRPTRLPA